MKTKLTASITFLIFLIIFPPVNSYSQRDPKGRAQDDRLKTRPPSNEQTIPKRKSGEIQNPIIVNPNPPVKEKPPEQKHPVKPYHPPIGNIPIEGSCIKPVQIPYPDDDNTLITEPD